MFACHESTSMLPHVSSPSFFRVTSFFSCGVTSFSYTWIHSFSRLVLLSHFFPGSRLEFDIQPRYLPTSALASVPFLDEVRIKQYIHPSIILQLFSRACVHACAFLLISTSGKRRSNKPNQPLTNWISRTRRNYCTGHTYSTVSKLTFLHPNSKQFSWKQTSREKGV